MNQLKSFKIQNGSSTPVSEAKQMLETRQSENIYCPPRNFTLANSKFIVYFENF